MLCFDDGNILVKNIGLIHKGRNGHFLQRKGFVIGRDTGQDGFENGSIVWVTSNFKRNG